MVSAVPVAVRPRHDSSAVSLKEQAYLRLRDLVLSGEMAEIPFLSERKLAQRLGMSNTPVRSAVERLEQEGILTIGPQKGIAVRELTDREIRDHYEIREAVEVLVVRKLAGRLTTDQLSELRANVDAMEARLEAGEMHEFITLDGDYHLLLAACAGNADVEQLLLRLRNRIFRVITRVIQHVPHRLRPSVDEHRRIIDLLERGDADGAAAVMSDHLRLGLQALLPKRRAAADATPELRPAV